ncbi:hypothetical protein CDO73_08265 [Saccharibacillus sp. O23]|uniref:YojF family protein n=1 Tax=Saccharibacillus sp. O23 TaxID=2009338 RepID=UPI000B4E6EE4|nr:YojF family protein [Saccharibacillus sp. O23]OWR31123.1 hypothetical protein CDO73_08265 [Saccharibacillus sp. O23]
MLPIQPQAVQELLDKLKDQELYLHLELTNGAYTFDRDRSKLVASNLIRNVKVSYSHGSISGSGPYRVGLKMPEGWIYAEGLTHYEETETERAVLAGNDNDGKLVVSLMLSPEPF